MHCLNNIANFFKYYLYLDLSLKNNENKIFETCQFILNSYHSKILILQEDPESTYDSQISL